MYNPKAPCIEYSYSPSNLNDKFSLLTEKRYERKLFKKIAYYHKGDNDLDGMRVEIRKGDDRRIDRVKLLKAPVGPDNSTVVTHRFKYNIVDKKSKDAYGNSLEVDAGITEVFDAYFRRKVYHYNRSHRLTRLEHFKGINPPAKS